MQANINSLQATRDGAFNLSRSRGLAAVTDPACLNSLGRQSL
jgi:hypothetical protein